MNWKDMTQAAWKSQVLAAYPRARFESGGTRNTIRVYAWVGQSQVAEFIASSDDPAATGSGQIHDA